MNELGIISGVNSPGINKFQQQFIDLRRFAPINDNSQDFYSGYQPTWNTILTDDDAQLDKTNQATTDIVNLAISEQIYQKIVLLTGNPGSGKIHWSFAYSR